MRRYLLFFIILCTMALILFFAVEEMDIRLLKNPEVLLHQGGLIAACAGIGLLIADVILPIPASLVMIAHGAIFGVWLGSLFSLIGGVMASCAGYYLGYKSGPMINKFITMQEQEQASDAMKKWGGLAVLISRPIPLMAESISIMAGVIQMPVQKFIIASLLGILPAAIIFAITGVYALEMKSGIWSFGIVLLVAGFFWVIGKYKRHSSSRSKEF